MTDPAGHPVSRRGVLRTVAVAAAAGLAGCGAVDSYEFDADPVVLPPAARDRLGYRETLREPYDFERTETVGGADVTVTVESPVAVYETATAVTATDPVVGVASTPTASIRGRSLNPLVRLSTAEVLDSGAGSRLLDQIGVDRVGHDRPGVDWERSPTLVRDRPARCLDRETTLESYAGLLAGDPTSVVGVHLTRVTADSVVLAAAAHGRDADTATGTLVGPDGHLSPDEFDGVADLLTETTPELQYV